MLCILSTGCTEDWDATALRDEELEAAFFSGLGAMAGVPFRRMARLEIRPDETFVEKGFRFPTPGSTIVTQDDFPALIDAIVRACDAKLGARARLPAARPGEASRKQG